MADWIYVAVQDETPMNNEGDVDVDTPRVIFVFLLTLSIVVILGAVFFLLSLLSAFSEFTSM